MGTKKLSEMTSEELIKEKDRLYAEAIASGKTTACAMVCRHLGTLLNTRYGPKYQYKDNGLELYVDDYGGFQTARFNGKLVMSTHFCEQLFATGPWFDMVLSRVDESAAVEQKIAKEKETALKNKLLAKLFAS